MASSRMLHARSSWIGGSRSHGSIAGTRARVVFANTYGTSALNVGGASIALRDKDSVIVPASLRKLTVNGSVHAVLHEQKTFDLLLSSTWTSMPMTASYSITTHGF